MTTEQIQSCIAERENILAWQKIAKKREMELRIAICSALLPQPIFGKIRGTFNGRPYSIEYPYKLEVDKAAIGSILANMPEGTGDKCIKYEPSLIKKGDNKLPDH